MIIKMAAERLGLYKCEDLSILSYHPDNHRLLSLSMHNSCVEMIENYDRRDDDGKVGRFALMVRERRFMIYHNRWLTSIGH